MLKKTINYTDFNGVERTENFYFNLTKAELMEMEMGTVGGMREMLRTIVEKQDIPKIIETIKMLIMKSYGEKSPDGRRFIKSSELSNAFAQTEAFSELYMELISNADETAAFVNGIVPFDVAANANNEAKKTDEPGNVSLLGDVT